MDETSELTSPPGWYPDPVHRYEFRWYNGRGWTADVSVDGQRFVDSLQQPDAAWTTRPNGPKRTLGVLAMIFGLCGVALAWAPFVFVLGGLCAVAGIVLGIVALRHIASGRAAGRRMAVTGLVTGIAALGLCVVGFVFTRVVVDEINDYTDPGPVHAVVNECSADELGLQIKGTVRNDDDHAHDYVIVIAISDHAGQRATSRVAVDDVQAGQVQDWSTVRITNDVDAATVQCSVRDVDGPYPFGLEAD